MSDSNFASKLDFSSSVVGQIAGKKWSKGARPGGRMSRLHSAPPRGNLCVRYAGGDSLYLIIRPRLCGCGRLEARGGPINRRRGATAERGAEKHAPGLGGPCNVRLGDGGRSWRPVGPNVWSHIATWLSHLEGAQEEV